MLRMTTGKILAALTLAALASSPSFAGNALREKGKLAVISGSSLGVTPART